MKKLSVLLLMSFCVTATFAQDDSESVGEGFKTVDEGFNDQSAHPIHRSDIMWQKTVWRALDLREKQNEPLFSENMQITKILIDAAKAGEVNIWKSDSLDRGQPLTLDEFLKNMEIPSTEAVLTEEEKAMKEAQEAEEDEWGDSWGDEEEEEEETEAVNAGVDYYFPKDMYQIELREDQIFDKQRSRMYYDIIAITLKIPADHPENIYGTEQTVAAFSYKDLMGDNGVFKNHPDAIWFNPLNDAEHRTLAEALELRLFSSYIIKVSNPKDAYLVDIHGGDQWTGILASQWKSFELLEYEHNLWEF